MSIGHITLPAHKASAIADLLDLACDWLAWADSDPHADLAVFLADRRTTTDAAEEFIDALADAAAALRGRANAGHR
ncbi:MAG TPA: hypothetical protein VF069_00305 [Streptosporangiaceae bacterium]